MPFSHDHVRLVIDEDLPGLLAEHLRARGYKADYIQDPDVRGRILDRRTNGDRNSSIGDPEVAEETAQTPSVLVTLNLRDYSDPRQHEELVERWSISIVQVRVPKAERGAMARPQAIHDIVHRLAHRLVKLYDGAPTISTAQRSGLRTRTLAAIMEGKAKRERKNEELRRQIAAEQARRQARKGESPPRRPREEKPNETGGPDRLFET